MTRKYGEKLDPVRNWGIRTTRRISNGVERHPLELYKFLRKRDLKDAKRLYSNLFRFIRFLSLFPTSICGLVRCLFSNLKWGGKMEIGLRVRLPCLPALGGQTGRRTKWLRAIFNTNPYELFPVNLHYSSALPSNSIPIPLKKLRIFQRLWAIHIKPALFILNFRMEIFSKFPHPCPLLKEERDL